MKLAISPEQQELRESVRRFLADRAPLPRVRELMETQTGLDLDVWRHAAGQLGLTGIAIGEEYGGSGFSFAEQALVCEELGAALFTGPYLASAVFAANALLACSDEGAKRDLLPGIASGETIATLAFTEDDGSWEPDAIRLSATKNGRGWSLDGHKSFILDGYTAGLLLVIARTDGGLSLFAVDAGPSPAGPAQAGPDRASTPGQTGMPGHARAPGQAGEHDGEAGHAGAPGLTRAALPTLDQTRKLARCEFASVPARLIGSPGDGTAILNRVLDVGAIALAAEQLGGAQRALDTVVAYAKVRHQFGRPIGSFQAIKHRCADLLLEVESLRSAVAYAAAAVAEGSPEVPVLASLVKALGSDVYFHVAAESIQMHGGIGFTWEHDAHLYFKRAKSTELFLGDPSHHRERLATRLGI